VRRQASYEYFLNKIVRQPASGGNQGPISVDIIAKLVALRRQFIERHPHSGYFFIEALQAKRRLE
jgi:hypothetical protein